MNFNNLEITKVISNAHNITVSLIDNVPIEYNIDNKIIKKQYLKKCISESGEENNDTIGSGRIYYSDAKTRSYSLKFSSPFAINLLPISCMV